MAKSKRARALFEVMNRTKLAETSGGTARSGNGITAASTAGVGITSPKWWFKPKAASENIKTFAPGERPAVAASDPTESVDNDPTLRAPAAAASMSPPLPSSIDVPDVSPGSVAPRVQPVSVSVDPDRQQISLRLSYTSALIGGFSLFIAIAIAVLIGKSLSRGPATALAGTSTQQLRAKPPTPGVLNVPRRGEMRGANDVVEGSASRIVSSTTPPSTGTRNPQHAQPTFNEPKPPATFFTDDPRRQVGLNYAIIQSYPTRESADKAAEFLTKNGVACTVERNLPGWPLSWKDGCVVVGIRGFAKVSNNPPLDAYKKSIMELGAKFSGRSRFDAFSPTMYLWKKTN